MGDNNFQPVNSQNIGTGTSAYQVTVTNNTASAVTVMGFAVTFSAFGSQIGTDNPTVNAALMEPGEKWNFTIDVINGIEVSDNTFLNETCTVTSVDTASGTLTPSMVPEQNGVQNTAGQLQVQLSTYLVTLQNDTSALNSDTTLAAAVSQMQKDWQQEQADWSTESASSCPNNYPIDGGDTVGTEADAVGTDYDELQSAVSQLQDGKLAAVSSDLGAVQKDLTGLQDLGAKPDVSTSAAISAGNNAIASADAAIKQADGQGNSINTQAQDLATTAENYANSHLCD